MNLCGCIHVNVMNNCGTAEGNLLSLNVIQGQNEKKGES